MDPKKALFLQALANAGGKMPKGGKNNKPPKGKKQPPKGKK